MVMYRNALPALIIVLVFGALPVTALTGANGLPSATQMTNGPTNVVGTLADIAQNRLNGRTPISTLKPSCNLWALGMPHGLSRELLVEDGKIMSGGYSDHQYVLDHPHDADAAFLIHACVREWTEVVIPASVQTFSDLERFVASAGQELGYNEDTPFAFRLSTKAKYLRWFVVGGMGNLQADPRSSFNRSRTLGGLDNVRIEALGFYSLRHRGIATNPQSNMHIHFRTLERKPFVGHLDDEILLEPGATLFLPKSN